MLGSLTSSGRATPRADAVVRVPSDSLTPRRRVRGNVTRYVFIEEDLHLILLLGLTAHQQQFEACCLRRINHSRGSG